jgi:hypothetical protein
MFASSRNADTIEGSAGKVGYPGWATVVADKAGRL